MNKNVHKRIQRIQRKKQLQLDEAKEILKDFWYSNQRSQTPDKKQLSVEDSSLCQFKTLETSNKQKINTGNYVIYKKKFLKSLSTSESKLIFNKIEPKLKINNLLIHLPKEELTTRETRTMKLLERKGIIFCLNKKDIYLLNPEFIRQGKSSRCIAYTLNILENRKVLSPKVCIKLGQITEQKFNMFE